MSLFNRLKLMVGIKNKSLKLSDKKIKKYFFGKQIEKEIYYKYKKYI